MSADEYYESIGEVCYVDFTNEHIRFPREKYGGVAMQIWMYQQWRIRKHQSRIDKLETQLKETEGIIDFYANTKNWFKWVKDSISRCIGGADIDKKGGGKRAREYQQKWRKDDT